MEASCTANQHNIAIIAVHIATFVTIICPRDHGHHRPHFSKFPDFFLAKQIQNVGSSCSSSHLTSTYTAFPSAHPLRLIIFEQIFLLLKGKSIRDHSDPKGFAQPSMVLNHVMLNISIFPDFSSKYQFFLTQSKIPQLFSDLEEY